MSLANLPQFHIFDYMHIAHWLPRLRQNGGNMLDSKGLRHHAYLLVATPRRLVEEPSSVDRREVFEGCCFFLHKGVRGELPHFHRSPYHGSARFCFRPETNRIEVYEVTFQYLGLAHPYERQVTFYQGAIDDIKLGIHMHKPWCVLRRSVRKEQNPEFIYWSINAPVMDENHPGFPQQLRSYM